MMKISNRFLVSAIALILPAAGAWGQERVPANPRVRGPGRAAVSPAAPATPLPAASHGIAPGPRPAEPMAATPATAPAEDRGNIVGKTLDSSRAVLGGASIRFVAAAPGPGGRTIMQVTSDPKGAFKVENLPAGHYLLSAWKFRGQLSPLVCTREVDVRAGKTTDLGGLVLMPQASRVRP